MVSDNIPERQITRVISETKCIDVHLCVPNDFMNMMHQIMQLKYRSPAAFRIIEIYRSILFVWTSESYVSRRHTE